MKKITKKQILFFIDNLRLLLDSGIPIILSLDMISQMLEQKSSTLDFILETMKHIQDGHSFADSLLKSHRLINPIIIETIRIGEETGQLEVILKHITEQLKRQIAFKKRLIHTLFYPTLTLLVGIIVTSILMIVVIPQFQSLFSGFGGQLPGLTRFIIGFSQQFSNHLLDLLAITSAIIFLYYLLAFAPQPIRFRLDRFKFKIPKLKDWLQVFFLAPFSNQLALTLHAGVPLLNALKLTKKTSKNLYIQAILSQIQQAIEGGDSFKTSLENTKFFPVTFLQFIHIGEENGKLDHMLQKSANFYEKQIDQTISWVMQWIEPFLMVALGIIIGTLIVAMYLPIFKLGMNF